MLRKSNTPVMPRSKRGSVSEVDIKKMHQVVLGSEQAMYSGGQGAVEISNGDVAPKRVSRARWSVVAQRTSSVVSMLTDRRKSMDVLEEDPQEHLPWDEWDSKPTQI